MPERIRKRNDTSREELLGASTIENRLLASPDDGYLIARRAYERFETRGGAHGHDLEDWLAAEREVRDRASDFATPLRNSGDDDRAA